MTCKAPQPEGAGLRAGMGHTASQPPELLVYSTKRGDWGSLPLLPAQPPQNHTMEGAGSWNGLVDETLACGFAPQF